MLTKDKFIKVILLVIAGLLALNILARPMVSLLAPEAEAQQFQTLGGNPFRGEGSGITCSGDGQYVYAVGSRVIYRSVNFGAKGSWELVLVDQSE